MEEKRDKDIIRKRLMDMAEDEYRAFSAKLVPNVSYDALLGVRMPQIRALAKELTRKSSGGMYDEAVENFLKEVPHTYMEENHLHCAIMGERLKKTDEALAFLDEFLPYVDNWAVCDSIVLKALKKDLPAVRETVGGWLEPESDGMPQLERAGQPYKVRYAIVTFMRYFLDEMFEEEDLYRLAQMRSDEYYINMALAWYYSFALVKQYDKTLPIFERRLTEQWVHNKAIQKARESFRISAERKDYLNTLKY